MENIYITVPIILLLAGIALAFMEILIPSGGILALLSAAAFITSVALAFVKNEENTLVGLVFLALAMAVIPVVVILGFKMLPGSPIGKIMTLHPVADQDIYLGTAGVVDKDYTQLIGKTGKTLSPLRPSGIAEIDGIRYSVVSDGTMIDNDVDIVVCNVQGNSIEVEKA